MNIPSSRVKISLTETQFGAADTQALARRLGAVTNWIIDYINNSSFPVGTVEESDLSEALFQARKGVGWILADGRSVIGSAYQTLFGDTNAPDMRGFFVRGKNYARSSLTGDPTGDHATGFTNTADYKSHTHTTIQGGLNPWPIAWTTGFPFPINDTDSGSDKNFVLGSLMSVNISLGATYTLSTSVVGSATDIKPMYVAKNFFIRIN